MKKMTSSQELLAKYLHEIGAIKFGAFRLKLHETHPHAPLSPLYIDLRVLRRFPEAKKVAIDVYEALVKSLKFDLLADVPTAATPLVSSLSDRLNVGMITPRGDSKKHGSGAKIDGMIDEDKGKTVVMIDDLVTGADSKIEAAETLKKHGLVVHDVVVLVDREQGGAIQLGKSGLTLHAAISLSQLFEYYLRTGILNEAKLKEIKQGIDAITAYLKTN